MREDRKFDPRSIDKLNDPVRLSREDPDVIWKELALADPRVLVDIGAGTGFFAVPFSRRLARGRVYACDLQEEMLAWMREHLPADVRDRIVPVRMEETRVPLEDGNADLVYMINLHHELEDPAAIMGEAYRLLKRGGAVAVIDWKQGETPSGPPQEIRIPEDRIAADIAQAGFRDIARHPVLPYHSFVTGKKP
jgi:ubiquinone/menaquinone biosynthesis C-methylase UbiE